MSSHYYCDCGKRWHDDESCPACHPGDFVPVEELEELRARLDEYEKALAEIECHVSASVFGPCSCSQLIARAALEKGRTSEAEREK